MKAWTDYPLPGIDEAYKLAPIRQVEVIDYDHDKYCKVVFDGNEHEIKRGYLFSRKGRVGEVPCVRSLDLEKAFPKALTR